MLLHLLCVMFTICLPQVFKNNQSTDGMLRSYCDGTGFKNHTLFQRDPFALQLHLFYDDLEVSNPLGSKASIHKLGRYMK